MQQGDLERVALNPEAPHFNTSYDVSANRAEAGRAIVNSGYSGEVSGDDVPEARAQSSVKPPFWWDAAATNIPAANGEICALLERGNQTGNIGRLV